MGDFFLALLWCIIGEGLEFVDRVAPRERQGGQGDPEDAKGPGGGAVTIVATAEPLIFHECLKVETRKEEKMAYIIWGYLPKGKGYYVDLWEDPEDPETSYEFHTVATPEEREQLIKRLQDEGHELQAEEQR